MFLSLISQQLYSKQGVDYYIYNSSSGYVRTIPKSYTIFSGLNPNATGNVLILSHGALYLDFGSTPNTIGHRFVEFDLMIYAGISIQVGNTANLYTLSNNETSGDSLIYVSGTAFQTYFTKTANSDGSLRIKIQGDFDFIKIEGGSFAIDNLCLESNSCKYNDFPESYNNPFYREAIPVLTSTSGDSVEFNWFGNGGSYYPPANNDLDYGSWNINNYQSVENSLFFHTFPDSTASYYVDVSTFDFYGCGIYGAVNYDVVGSSTGLERYTTKQLIKLYPNPTSSVLNIDISGEVTGLSITSINGQIVKQKTSVFNKQISVVDLEKGIYNISVTTAIETYSYRFIVE